MKSTAKRLLFTFALVFLLSSCGGEEPSSSPSYESTSLTNFFKRLQDNNFTYTVSFVDEALGTSSSGSFRYTPYSFETSGYPGEEGIAQGDGYIFRYSLKTGSVVASTPTLASSSGLRYASIYDFTPSFENLDLSTLPSETDEEGYYEYVFGEDESNDALFVPVLARRDASGLAPKSLKLRPVGETLEVQGVIRSDSDGSNALRFEGYVTDVGTTENTLIKEYLDSGKTALEPIDKRFLSFMNPFFHSHNYTIDFDATGLRENGEALTFQMTEYDDETAAYFVPHYEGGGTPTGYFEYLGAVHKFNVIDEKLVINQTVTADSEGNFYETVFGASGLFSTGLDELSFSNLVGYIDPDDGNSYIITDDQFVYYLGDMCYISRENARYYDYVTITIIDEEKHEFEASFDCYNYSTKEDLGVYKAHFYDVGATSIPYVDEYVSIGEEPGKEAVTLEKALSSFKGHNYSLDIMSSAGLEKIYYTNKYVYQEIYGNESNNTGFLKSGDAIYAFSIADDSLSVNTSIDYASQYGMSLPGLGSYFQSEDDAGYFSCFREDDTYDSSKYEIVSSGGVSFYKNTASGYGKDALDYLYANPSEDVILPGGAGFRVGGTEDDVRLTFIISYIASDGSAASYYPLTFYDIGNTSVGLIEEYLTALS